MSVWRDNALCLAEDPELFFPLGEGQRSLAGIERAKAICQTCPALTICLDFAMSNDIEYGVWGGTTPRERRNMRRRAKAAAYRLGRQAWGANPADTSSRAPGRRALTHH